MPPDKIPLAEILWGGIFPQVYPARIWTIRQACNHPQCCLQGDFQHTRRPRRVFVAERGTCRAAQAKLGVQEALRKGPLSPRHVHVTCTASAAPSAPALLLAALLAMKYTFCKKKPQKLKAGQAVSIRLLQSRAETCTASLCMSVVGTALFRIRARY